MIIHKTKFLPTEIADFLSYWSVHKNKLSEQSIAICQDFTCLNWRGRVHFNGTKYKAEPNVFFSYQITTLNIRWKLSKDLWPSPRISTLWPSCLLTCFLCVCLDMCHPQVPVCGQGEVATQHQHQLLRVPLLQHQHQVLVEGQSGETECFFPLLPLPTSLVGLLTWMSTRLFTSSSLDTAMLLIPSISHKFRGWNKIGFMKDSYVYTDKT